MAFAAPIVLMHINVKILSAVRYRPLTQVSFHVHYFASKYAVSSRDECVVLAVMTVKESSTQLC